MTKPWRAAAWATSPSFISHQHVTTATGGGAEEHGAGRCSTGGERRGVSLAIPHLATRAMTSAERRTYFAVVLTSFRRPRVSSCDTAPHHELPRTFPSACRIAHTAHYATGCIATALTSLARLPPSTSHTHAARTHTLTHAFHTHTRRTSHHAPRYTLLHLPAWSEQQTGGREEAGGRTSIDLGGAAWGAQAGWETGADGWKDVGKR